MSTIKCETNKMVNKECTAKNKFKNQCDKSVPFSLCKVNLPNHIKEDQNLYKSKDTADSFALNYQSYRSFIVKETVNAALTTACVWCHCWMVRLCRRKFKTVWKVYGV